MKKVLCFIAGSLALLCQQAIARDTSQNLSPQFKENKGQLTDQNRQLRNDILYYGNSDGLSYFFRTTGISYQLYEKGKAENDYVISRIDLTWLGGNPGTKVSAENVAAGVDNFYNTTQPITGVQSFEDLQYQEIYNGINLHYYYKDGSLKYDFIVAPGADYKKIRIKVEGATAINENKDGSISIITPNGKLIEGKPVTYQEGKEVPTNWTLEGDVLSFDVAGYNPALPLVIDPLVYQWARVDADQTESASYSSTANFYRNAPDAYGNVYTARNRLMPGGLNQNLIRLYKYSNSPTPVWSKWLSGPTFSDGTAIEGLSTYDTFIYISGEAANTATIATSGAYQTTVSGQKDGFLLKYDSSGTKVWGTYYGGTSNDVIKSCKVDSAGYIYVCGATQSTGNIAGTGAQQGSLAGITDAFVAKFSTVNGYRTWATYFGGSNIDSAKNIDVYGNRLYIAGVTKSTSGIATSGAHQTAFSGNINGFLLCMDTSGVTQWSTYYGADSTFAERCITNGSEIYLSGSTNATGSIATPGTYQSANAGAFDGFLVKFNLSGVRQWGTYYGGTARDFAKGSTLGSNGNIYISGNTKSTAGITTPNSYNPTYVVGQYYINGQHIGVAYLAELNSSGQRVSGTYYNSGGSADWCSANSSGDIYISGLFAYIYEDCKPFVAKFAYCNASTPIVTASSSNICANSSVQLSTPAVSGASYQWYRNDVLITGATANSYNATQAGTYKLIINQCPSGVSDNIVLTTSPLPTTAILKTDAACAVATNGSITVTPSGGTAPYSYTWDNSTNITATLSGLIPGTYIVHTSDANTCVKTDTITITNTNNVPVSTATHTNVPCYGDPLATITVSTTGGATPYAYVWDNMTATTPYLDGLTTGTYIVHTTDSNNCSDVDTIEVEQNTEIEPSNPLASICAVTVDSATGKNMVIWKKDGLVKATAYNIYRESSVAGQYDLIGTKDVSDDPVLIDNTAIPLQQSYIYKVAEVDSCDHEWPMSDFHKTVHLSASVGVNGENNLSWNAYEGKPYSTHRIMRSFNGGPYVLLNEVSSTITAYSDLTPPLGVNVYRIEIDLGPVCDSTASQYVVSNKQSLGTTTGINGITSENEVEILPNPTSGMLHIKGRKPEYLEMYDATGKLVLKKDGVVTDLNIGSFAKGVYMIHLFDKSGTLYHGQKIVLQ